MSSPARDGADVSTRPPAEVVGRSHAAIVDGPGQDKTDVSVCPSAAVTVQDPGAIDVDRNPAPKRQDAKTGTDGRVTKALKPGQATAPKRQDAQSGIDGRATKALKPGHVIAT